MSAGTAQGLSKLSPPQRCKGRHPLNTMSAGAKQTCTYCASTNITPRGNLNPGQNSWDIKAIACQNDLSFLIPPLTAMLISGIQVILLQSPLLGGHNKNSLFQKHSQAFLRTQIYSS